MQWTFYFEVSYTYAKIKKRELESDMVAPTYVIGARRMQLEYDFKFKASLYYRVSVT